MFTFNEAQAEHCAYCITRIIQGEKVVETGPSDGMGGFIPVMLAHLKCAAAEGEVGGSGEELPRIGELDPYYGNREATDWDVYEEPEWF
jgi:hypothetical protein